MRALTYPKTRAYMPFETKTPEPEREPDDAPTTTDPDGTPVENPSG